MDFNEYQFRAGKTAIYPGKNGGEIDAISYCTLGLVGEAGEIANKVKKILRDGDGVITTEHTDTLAKELGDVLWYVARTASEIGWDLGDIAGLNIERLQSRQERGVLTGSGDDR